MTDKQAAIAALDKFPPKSDRPFNDRYISEWAFKYQDVIRAALQSKPVDVEGLKRDIHKHFHPLHSYQGSTVITIDKMIDHLHTKGYLNTKDIK